ncbi:MAG TPA: DNA topoisomerase IB [Chthoniobacteraceae bacterium]|jgi:DNA topoisomerase-1
MAVKSVAAPLQNPFVAALAAEAREAGLRYTSDEQPGIRRQRQGDDFVFIQPNGKQVTDPETLRRIKRLVIPPAWEEVWISPHENGHIQATGRDARRRKQYRYHPDWRAQRDQNKFGRMLAFARALPRLRKRVDRDLQRRGLPREKVLATVVRLLEATLIRVGNDEYARHNKSYGLTTMHDRHVKVKGGRIHFAFKGKSGKRHEISFQDAQLAKIVKRCQDLPGQELFAYEDENGQPRDVGSQDVNNYLRSLAGEEFTAKDFRTWAGTVLAAIALREFQAFSKKAEAKKNVVAAIEAVASTLGNTPAVCRKCYVHPVILESYLQGNTIATLQQRVSSKLDRSLAAMRPDEAAVMVLLQEGLKAKQTPEQKKRVERATKVLARSGAAKS